MKRIILGLLVFLGMFIAAPSPAYAHVLEADGDIGAVLHIEPSDNPVSGQPVRYDLYFQDVSNRFSLPACDCTVTYLKDGKQVAKMPLNASQPLTSVNNFTFPQPATYELKVSGKPKTKSAFQPFNLTFTLRAVSGKVKVNNASVLLWAGLGGAICIIMLAAYTSESAGNNPKSGKEE